MIKPKGLGRGLDALLGSEAPAKNDTLTNLAVAKIQPGKYQPRTQMNQTALVELAASIKAQGLMQPVLVRPIGRDRYELIAGERRWRASQLAGLDQIPALVREVPDEATLAMALIENIQREDLNPMEEALGLQRLVDEFKLTHQQAADAVGRSRSAASNLLRLLNLSKAVQTQLMAGELEMGHARALLALDNARQVEAANRVIAGQLSVRETETLVQHWLGEKTAAARKKARKTDRDLARLQEEAAENIGTAVEIKPGAKGRGKLVLHYVSFEHLDELLARLKAR
jgi:ParB family chromosome partitioning protein